MSKEKINKQYQALPGETSFEKVFPIEIIEDDMLILKNGNICIGLKLTLPPEEQLTAEDYISLNKGLQNSLLFFPSGTVCHFQDRYFHSKATLENRKKT